MISVLAQERVLGAALGSAFAGFFVLEERKRIYESISNDQSFKSQYLGKVLALDWRILGTRQ